MTHWLAPSLCGLRQDRESWPYQVPVEAEASTAVPSGCTVALLGLHTLICDTALLLGRQSRKLPLCGWVTAQGQPLWSRLGVGVGG